MTFWVLVFIAEMLEVKGTLYFLILSRKKRDGGYRNRYRFFAECFYLAAVTGIIGIKCILIILLMSLPNWLIMRSPSGFLFSIFNYTMLVLIDYVTALLGRGRFNPRKMVFTALISKTALSF